MHSLLGCFETPAIKVKSAKITSLEGSPDLLADHTSAPRTGNRKTRCVKMTSKDITIHFGKTSAIGEAAYMASMVLVGHI